MVEEVQEASSSSSKTSKTTASTVMELSEVATEDVARRPSGLELLDRVLGGGVVTGGAVLLAGEPGIGKSTLLLQMAESLVRQSRKVLYASAEESPRQLRLRAERLGSGSPGLLVTGETLLEPLLAAAAETRPAVLFVDSVQALRSADLESPPGSIGQVRHVANRLVDFAKRNDTALFLVGHVNKEGAIAGPKSLEHLVDTVLAFEGGRDGDLRILRATKNRFGPTGELALYTMRDTGLEPVTDPSRVLLDRRRVDAPGSAVVATVQGSRPLLVEVQALVQDSSLPTPRRAAVGLDGSRLGLLVAVLQRFGGISLAGADLFVNVVGGLSLREPAVDLGVAAAILSAVHATPLSRDAAFFGEIGLLGEIRPVSRIEPRLNEIASHGFRLVYGPDSIDERLPDGLRACPLGDLAELSRTIVGRHRN